MNKEEKKKDQQTFLSGLFKFSIGPLGAALISFLTIPITTWLVSPEEFGKATMFSLVQTFITSFLFLGMDHAYAREFNEQKDKKKLLFNALLFPFILSILLSVITLIFATQLTHTIFNTEETFIIYLFALWIPFITLENLLLLNIRMKEKGLAFSLFNIFLRLSIMLLTILFLTLFSKNYISIVSAAVIGQIIIDVFLIIYCRKDLKIKKKYIDFSLTKKMFSFGFPWIPTTIIGWVLISSDRIFLERYTNFKEVGIYFAAMKVIGILGVIQSVFISYWSPVSYRWNKEGVDFKKFTIVSHYLMFVLALLFSLILLLKDIIISILSPEYAEASLIIPFLLFYPIMNTVSTTTALGIPFSRKTHYNIWISMIAAISNVLLNILLIPYFGAIGAAIATGVSYIVFFWIRTLISRKLWYKFELNYYIKITIFLFLAAILNVIIKGFYIHIINIISVTIIIYISRNLLDKRKIVSLYKSNLIKKSSKSIN
jgi:O-antigen/teichoic acid export membrane protein